MNLAAEQHIPRKCEHEDAACNVDGRVLVRQELPDDRCAHGNREDDRRDPGGEEEGHRHQQTAILERAGKVGGQHDRDTAWRKERDGSRDDRGQHRTAEKDATTHHVTSLSGGRNKASYHHYLRRLAVLFRFRSSAALATASASETIGTSGPSISAI